MLSLAPSILTLFSLKGFILQQSELSAQYFGPGVQDDGNATLPLAPPHANTPLGMLFKLAPQRQLQEVLASLQLHGVWAGAFVITLCGRTWHR